MQELTPDIFLAIHCLQVATNWVADPLEAPSLVGEGEEEVRFPVSIAECLVPEAHPLWVPALRAPPLAEALIHFLVSASSHAEGNPTPSLLLEGLYRREGVSSVGSCKAKFATFSLRKRKCVIKDSSPAHFQERPTALRGAERRVATASEAFWSPVTSLKGSSVTA